MKYIFTIMLVLSTMYSRSQKMIFYVTEIQNFEHPIMTTNEAIIKDQVSYLTHGLTNLQLTVDTNKKMLIRKINNSIDTLPIIKFEKKIEKYNFNVLYQKKMFNYVILLDNSNLEISRVICRWVEDKKVKGWDSKESQIKKEND